MTNRVRNALCSLCSHGILEPEPTESSFWNDETGMKMRAFMFLRER